MRIRYLKLLVFGLVSCGVVEAQDRSGRDSTIFLKDEVVITAQRMEANSSAVAEAVVTATQAEIVRLPSLNTPDAMSSMAGVWMQKTNHGGGSPFIRGLTGYYTLILTDGIRFNNSTFRSGPNQYLVTIHWEVVRVFRPTRGIRSLPQPAGPASFHRQTRHRK